MISKWAKLWVNSNSWGIFSTANWSTTFYCWLPITGMSTNIISISWRIPHLKRQLFRTGSFMKKEKPPGFRCAICMRNMLNRSLQARATSLRLSFKYLQTLYSSMSSLKTKLKFKWWEYLTIKSEKTTSGNNLWTLLSIRKPTPTPKVSAIIK